MKRRIQIPVAVLEFDEGGHTFWVHSPNGATILRVKCKGTINVRKNFDVVSHSDILVDGDIEFCLADDVIAEN